ncbi:hypothetical protein ACHAQA_008783 [Verticillium albo-atrum]
MDQIDLAEADAHFWSMTGTEMKDIDPQQRLALEVAYECLQNSGTTKWQGKKIGTYFGTFGEDWANMQTRETLDTGIYRISGYGDFALANRVAYEFGFEGPSMVVRTACSSSLIALHEACMALYSGECESAIVGGTNIILNPCMTVFMSTQGVMSKDGRCKTFDARADGYARGEGAVAIHVKKLSDAIRDNDPIRAVIRASCLNSDGRTSNMLQPSSESHEALIRRSHALAGIQDLSKTAMIECHGTGTPIGDPLEAKAVANVFGEYGIYIGSTKPNFGHSEGASGITSVIKMMLALERGQIPPNNHFEIPNPKIPFEEWKLKVPVELTPWPKDREERAGVNSFGIGGSNAHVLLESAKCAGVSPMDNVVENEVADNYPYLLTFSANSQDALRAVVQSHEAYLHAHPEKLHDLSYNLTARREALPYRAFAVVDKQSVAEPINVSPFERGDRRNQLVFVFTGQGAQWAGMGARLLESNAVFRQVIGRLEAVLEGCDPPPSWSLTAELEKAEDHSRLAEAEFSQPCCTALQIGLVDVLRNWGVEPHAVVGHSSGEIAAAYTSGALSARDAIRVAYYRGLAAKTRINSASPKGAMAAVGLGRQDVAPFLQPGVIVGCENSPSSITLSGDQDVLPGVLDAIKAAHEGVLVKQLGVDCAYHSHHMESVARDYTAMLGKLRPQASRLPFYSSVAEDDDANDSASAHLDSSYWVRNMVSPVCFSQAISRVVMALNKPSLQTLFLEVGPHSALSGPLKQIFRAEKALDVAYSPTLIRSRDAAKAIMAAVGRLFQAGIDVDFSAVAPKGKVLTDMPTYPWQRSGNYWSESRVSKAWRLRGHPHHDILGSRVGEVGNTTPTWRNLLRIDDVPWVRDHRVLNDIFFPGAGYVAMAGEAVRQLTGLSDFTVRDVVFPNALVMHEGTAAEVITTAKPVRLTTSLESVWYDFVISSLRNNIWVKHAFGQVRGGKDFEDKASDLAPLPRQVSSAKWYSVMDRAGLNYGPRFRGLTSISASATRHEAVAVVKSTSEHNESGYALHPGEMDSAFQLFSVAAFKGLSRLFSKVAVLSSIGELYIKPTTDDILVKAFAKPANRGAFSGDAIGTSENQTVFKLKDISCSQLPEAEDPRGDDPHAAVELVWKPDVNLVDTSSLLRTRADSSGLNLLGYRPLADKLGLVCIIETIILLENLEPGEAYLEKYRYWLGIVREQASNGTYPNVPECQDIVKMTSKDRLKMIDDLYATAKDTPIWPTTTATYRIFHACKEIFTGQVNPLSLLMEDGVLGAIYDLGRVTELGDFLSLCAHYKPNLKILEIGAGTGGTTNTILPALKSSYGERMYLSYTYTDVSSGFFVTAKKRFKDFESIEYKILDISQDPLEQGFAPNSFDVIVASNVIHATPRLTESLTNIRKLLAPKGRLFMQELCTPTKWVNFVMGTLPGWWLGEEDGRVYEPYLNPEGWERHLRAAGFDGIEGLHLDNQFNANMIVKVAPTQAITRNVTLLYLSTWTEEAEGIKQALEQRGGYIVGACMFGNTPRPSQDIVAILDLEEPFFHNINATRLAQFQELVSQAKGAGILWVTGAAQIKCKDPRYGLTMGLARTVRSEMELDLATLELEDFGRSAWDAVARVLPEFQSRPSRDDRAELNPNYEWAFADGLVHVGRFHWTSIGRELDHLGSTGSSRKLEIGTLGLLNSLSWKPHTPPALTGRAVQVKPAAVGLIFKDVLISMGIVDGHGGDDDDLGCECAGYVEKVGPDVQHLAVGDRVMVFEKGALATSFTTPEAMCVKIPDNLSFVDAASMPAVYATAIYCLLEKMQPEPGQSILIHSASGGVGVAAIHISRMLGLQIFCTVGNDEKAKHLMDQFDIPRSHIFNSHDLSFQRDVLEATDGRGVDVVLNSLSGELLHASWKCVAEFGCMIEMGKRDLVGKGALALEPFDMNRTYFAINFAHIFARRPEIISRLLKRTIELLEQGHIKPIQPITQFDASNIEDAMRFMQKGQHIGKVVIRMPESQDHLESKSRRPRFKLTSGATYVLVGGLGGIGQAIAVWMAESGAQEIVFLSPSAGDSARYSAFAEELKSLGCSAKLVAGSVASREDVDRALEQAGYPIRGVLHLSMVLNDAATSTMTFSEWQDTVAPKVLGTWNLHHALIDAKQNPEFFILFSSFSGLCGQWGQANYAAANTFLDSFTQYRHAQGLPSATVDVGAVQDVGYVSRNPQFVHQFYTTSTHALYEQDLLDSLQVMISRCATLSAHGKEPTTQETASETGRYSYVHKGQVALGVRTTQPLAAPNNRIIWKRDLRMALYRNLELKESTPTATGNERLKQFLSEVSRDADMLNTEDAAVFLAKEIGKTLFSFMLRDEEGLDISQPLSALGLDSLVAVELRNWFRQNLGFEMTVMQFMESPSLMDLGKKTAERLKEKHAAAVQQETTMDARRKEFLETKLP